MRNMGGLFRRMPRAAWTFVIGGLALSGFPILTGRLLEQGARITNEMPGTTVTPLSFSPWRWGPC